MTQTESILEVNFSELMSRVLNLLNPKERDVIERRFSIGGKPKETLDRIGRSYSITRERVRQIEAVAIKKLARISMDPSMRQIHSLAYSIIEQNGKVMLEDHLVTQMLQNMQETKDIDTNALRLAVRVSENITKQDKNQFYRPFWRLSEVSGVQVKGLIKQLQKILRARKDVMSTKELSLALEEKYDPKMIEAVLHVDWTFKATEDGWGLTSWRHINPKSIKDKIMISLNNNGSPLHFTEIVNRVLSDFNSKKMVTNQAIHNELIRHDDFVLVGRGMYALKDWGLAAGTVCDIIRDVLIENEGPMKRQEIIEAVLKRRDIRLGTISLNLQKYDFFKRVGRAVYDYVPELDKRRRNLKRLKKEA